MNIPFSRTKGELSRYSKYLSNLIIYSFIFIFIFIYKSMAWKIEMNPGRNCNRRENESRLAKIALDTRMEKCKCTGKSVASISKTAKHDTLAWKESLKREEEKCLQINHYARRSNEIEISKQTECNRLTYRSNLLLFSSLFD